MRDLNFIEAARNLKNWERPATRWSDILVSKNSGGLSTQNGNYPIPFWFFQKNKREHSPAPGHATSTIWRRLSFCINDSIPSRQDPSLKLAPHKLTKSISN